MSGAESRAGYRFVKGHGTRNDFVLLPDPDGSRHTGLDADRARALCDRRAGIGGDGVIRVVPTTAPDVAAEVRGQDAAWFMDYRNADGSLSEMCGNGVRVLGRHLAVEGLVDPTAPVPVATRDGVKVLTFAGGDAHGAITVDMGAPRMLGRTSVAIGPQRWDAVGVDMGNPHAVAFLDAGQDLGAVGDLIAAPEHDASLYPDGVNVEFVVRRGSGHVAMRVHERGSGETQSCGTGACAVMVAAATADEAPRGTPYRVDLPGGTLTITWTPGDRILMTGPAVLVAHGTTDL